MREHVCKNPSQEVDKESHPFRKDTAGREGRGENEILLNPARQARHAVTPQRPKH